MHSLSFIFFFFNDTATTEIYTLSLHDALPICGACPPTLESDLYSVGAFVYRFLVGQDPFDDSPIDDLRTKYMWASPQPIMEDRKSTRLNSSHHVISYAVFCLKKKKTIDTLRTN